MREIGMKSLNFSGLSFLKRDIVNVSLWVPSI
jgi:hypothetical protein